MTPNAFTKSQRNVLSIRHQRKDYVDDAMKEKEHVLCIKHNHVSEKRESTFFTVDAIQNHLDRSRTGSEIPKKKESSSTRCSVSVIIISSEDIRQIF